MNVNFILPTTKLTGGIRVAIEIANGLSERGHNVNVVSFGNPSDLNWIHPKFKTLYITRTFAEKIAGYCFRKVFGFQCWPEEETRKLLKLLPQSDINIATMSYTGFAAHRSRHGRPYHYFMHYEPLVREEGYKKKIIEESYFLPTTKIANSTWLAQVIKKETGQDVAGLVFPAIDHNVFFARKKEKKTINKNGEITIVSLAKYKKWKGLDDALKAVEIVRKRGYNVHFRTFGGQFNQSMLPNDVQGIEFDHVGPKMNDELAQFYSNADILISASHFESFPLPQIEAMACGTPVVTTRYGTEDYALDHKTALVVEPRNPTQMADAIIELIENRVLYEKLAEEGQKIAKTFTWEKSADQMERIFFNQ